MRIITSISLVLISTSLFSQNKLMIYADQLMEARAYSQAANNYRHAIERNSEAEIVIKASRKLAEAYYRNSEFKDALSTWEKYVENYGYQLSDLEIYHFAHTLCKIGDYKRAEESLSHVNDQLNKTKWIERMVNWPISQHNHSDPHSIEVTKTNIKAVNKGLGMAWRKKELYLSYKLDSIGIAKNTSVIQDYKISAFESISKINFIEKESDLWKEEKGGSFHSTPFLSNDDIFYSSSIYVNKTKSSYKIGFNKKKLNYLKIFRKEIDDRTLHPISLWDLESDYSFPHLYGDTILFFATNQPGGKGNFDIMYAIAKDTGWSEPMTIAGLNTEDHDVYPHVLGNKIYFSSKGYEGFGGMDIYEGTISFLDNGISVNDIKNLGRPINSQYDDFSYLLIDKNEGYFMSDRIGEGKDGVFWFGPKEDSWPIKTDAKENFVVEEEILEEENLSSDTKALQITNGNIYFESGKFHLTKNAIEILSDIVRLIKQNSANSIELHGYTDSQGSSLSNMLLSKDRVNAVVRFLSEKGISLDKIEFEYHGESTLTKCLNFYNCNEKENGLNRRVEFYLHVKTNTPNDSLSHFN